MVTYDHSFSTYNGHPSKTPLCTSFRLTTSTNDLYAAGVHSIEVMKNGFSNSHIDIIIMYHLTKTKVSELLWQIIKLDLLQTINMLIFEGIFYNKSLYKVKIFNQICKSSLWVL